jgi:ArsR family transcriptional regulator
MNPGSKSPHLAVLFAALADATRLRLLNLMAGDGLMAGREVCVCHFVEILGLGQPKISRHLAYLRKAGIATARREGKWMHYSICTPADPSAASILAAVLAAFANDRQMRTDLSKLNQSKPAQGNAAQCSAAQCSAERNQLKLNKPGLSKPGLSKPGQAKLNQARTGRACSSVTLPPVRPKRKNSACCGRAESA